MFEGWENFYLIVGPSAGALIGLMFVVVTLIAGRRNSQQYETGKHLYTSPIVWHLGVVLMLSAAAVAPPMTPVLLGSAQPFSRCRARARGAQHRRHRPHPHDRCRQLVRHVVLRRHPDRDLLGWPAPRLRFSGQPWGANAFAASLMALLLVSIHAEWDLVTFLAPRANSDRSAARVRGSFRSSSGESPRARTSLGRQDFSRR